MKKEIIYDDQIDLITGFLGSGKTTFIKKYATYLMQQGMNIGILENDFGAVNVDAMLLQDISPAGHCSIPASLLKQKPSSRFPFAAAATAVLVLAINVISLPQTSRLSSLTYAISPITSVTFIPFSFAFSISFGNSYPSGAPPSVTVIPAMRRSSVIAR